MAGIVLLLPLLGWAITGVFFFIKPGYDEAYAALTVFAYPLQVTPIEPESDWLETRQVTSILGTHVLARKANGWHHIQPDIDTAAAGRLFEDAITQNPQRYGSLLDWSLNEATTSTGIALEIDWPNLALSQRGEDTRLIESLYRIHYLQWTGQPMLDRVFAIVGLMLLSLLTLLGLRLALSS